MAWKKIMLEGDVAVLSDTPPVDVTKAAASAGTATQASRQDHKHDISTTAPGNITEGATASEGTSTSLARADHVHGSPSTWAPSSHALSGHTAAAANVNFAEYEATALSLQTATTNPSTTKAGRIVYNTTDAHPYVYQA
jgi:hypothetical protein